LILLDTNILSEVIRPAPAPVVLRWLGAQTIGSVFISAVTEAELRYGVALLPDGKRRAGLAAAIAAMLEVDFAGRILPFDSSAAIAYAEIASGRCHAGRPIAQADAEIAAIARSRGAALATRNVTDFVDCGVKIINPWELVG
jgi:predicted nucleic acid-binding protein